MGDREEIQRAKQQYEYEKLDEVWHIFNDGLRLPTDEHEEVHPSPALVALLRDRLTQATEWTREKATTQAEAVEIYSAYCSHLLVLMFRFGQFCNQLPQPIKYEDLAPCTCGTLTEEDIEKFLKIGE